MRRLQQRNPGLCAGFQGFFVPDAGLYLANVGAAQHQHGKTALADAAADGQGQLVVQEHLVEGQLPAVVAVRQGQLTIQRFRVHPDAHGGDLQRPVQGLVPEENITVQVPVVVVRRPAVVGLAGAKRAADLHDAGGFVLPDVGVFPLGAGFQIRVFVLQLLGGDEADLPAKLCAQLGITDVEPVVGIADRAHNGLDNELQEV